MKRIIIVSVLWCLAFQNSKGQNETVIHYDLAKLAENHKISVFNREVTPYSDGNRRGIRFSAKENDGVAWLDGVEVANGIIELDIHGKDVLQQSFVGVAFHGLDNATLDAIYFRPFNFQAQDPVRKIHAVQYVSHPDFPWNKLREQYNGKYEKGIEPAPKGTDWFHAKIVIRYPTVTVFVNNNSLPSLTIEQLSTRKKGKLGLWVGNGSDGDFANLKITSIE